MEQEIANLRRDVENLKNPDTVQKINDEIKVVEQQLKSLDITIRQQQELKAKRSELERNLSVIPSMIQSKLNRIHSIESKLSTIKHNFEHGSSCKAYDLREARYLLES